MKKILFILSLLSSVAFANDGNIYGYVTASAVISKDISIGGSSGKWSFDKNEVVVAGDKSFEHFDARFSVGTKDEPGLERGKVDIRHLLVDIPVKTPYIDVSGFRVGKVPHTLGLYHKWRHNPRYGEFIYLPEGIYREQFKWLAQSGWGGQYYMYTMLPDGSCLNIQTAIAKPDLSSNEEIVAGHVGNGLFGTFEDSGSWVKSLNVEYTTGPFLIHYDLTNLDFNFKSNMPSFMIPSGQMDTRVHTFGVRYYVNNDFDVSGEYLMVQHKGPVWSQIKQNMPYGHAEGFVFSVRYQLTDKLSISAYNNTYYHSNGDKDGTKTEASSMGMIKANSMFAHSNSIATNYKIDSKWSVRAQYTVGQGSNAVIQHLNPDPKKDWSYFATQVVFSF